MNRTLRWQLYVSAYTLCFGMPLLLFPNAVIPLFGFEPTPEPWIRLVGMFLLGLCYLSTTVYRRRVVALLLHSIIMRSGFALVFLALVLSGQSPSFYLTAAIVGLGVVGSTLAYRSERAAPARLAGERP